MGKEQEDSAHTSSTSNSKQTQKYCPWKSALARHRTRNMTVFITKGHKVPKYIAKHPSCNPQNMKVNIFQHLLVKDFETTEMRVRLNFTSTNIAARSPEYQQ